MYTILIHVCYVHAQCLSVADLSLYKSVKLFYYYLSPEQQLYSNTNNSRFFPTDNNIYITIFNTVRFDNMIWNSEIADTSNTYKKLKNPDTYFDHKFTLDVLGSVH